MAGRCGMTRSALLGCVLPLFTFAVVEPQAQTLPLPLPLELPSFSEPTLVRRQSPRMEQVGELAQDAVAALAGPHHDATDVAAPSDSRPGGVPTTSRYEWVAAQRAKRNRRHDDDCANGDDYSKNLHTKSHQFEHCPLGLTVQWVPNVDAKGSQATKSNDAMLVVCSVNTDTTDPDVVTNNLYQKSSTGKDFPPVTATGDDVECSSSTKLSLVADAVFSNTIHKNKQYWAFAAPTKKAASASSDKNHLWISDDDGKNFYCRKTQMLLDYFEPYPYDMEVNADPKEFYERSSWLLASADMGTADKMAPKLHFCKVNNHGKGMQLSCGMLHPSSYNVYSFEWAITQSSQNPAFMIAEPNGQGAQFFRIKSPDRASTQGHTITAAVSIKKAESFTQGSDGSFIYVITEQQPINGVMERQLHVSSDGGFVFDRTIFPYKGRHVNFAVVDVSKNVALVCVETQLTQLQGTVKMLFAEEGNTENLAPINAYRASFTEPPDPADPNRNLYYPAGEKSLRSTFTDNELKYGCDWSSLTDEDARRKFFNKVVVVHRGECKFLFKALAAEQIGVAALVIINTDDTYRLIMAAPNNAMNHPEIPVVIVASSDGAQLVTAYAKEEASTGGHKLKVKLIEENFEEKGLWKSTNLFTSDESGKEFVLSLPQVVYKAGNTWSKEVVDVYKVKSAAGTYIANFIDSDHNHSNAQVTLVTNNYGAHWRGLRIPDERNHRELHLGLQSSRGTYSIATPRSTKTAKGIVVANGWEDEHIPVGAEQARLARTFVSRDGGSTWDKVEVEAKSKGKAEYSAFEGWHDYRILDHGAVLVFIPRKASKYIHYSVDEGHGGTFPFEPSPGEDKSRVFDGIVTEPGGTSTSAYLYEHIAPDSGPTDNEWTGTRVDFKGVLTGGGSSEPTCRDNEYEWNPLKPNPDTKCFLGEQLELKRRKLCTGKPCWNSLKFRDESKEMKKCRCTRFDYKCKFGFVRKNVWDNSNAECVRDLAAPCKLGKMIPYTKIAHDACSGGENEWERDSEVIVEHCQQAARRTNIGAEVGRAFGYLVLFLVVVALAITLVLTMSKSARDKTIRTLGTEEGCAGKIGTWLAQFSCFRAIAEAKVYSQLSISSEDATTRLSGDAMDSESEDEDEDDLDDILFGLDSKNIEGPNTEESQS